MYYKHLKLELNNMFSCCLSALTCYDFTDLEGSLLLDQFVCNAFVFTAGNCDLGTTKDSRPIIGEVDLGDPETL